MDTEEKIQVVANLALWAIVVIMLLMASQLYFFSEGKDWLRYEKNKPLIAAYEECVAKPNHYASFQCNPTYNSFNLSNGTWRLPK